MEKPEIERVSVNVTVILKLKEWLKGNCPHWGCSHNVSGNCRNDSAVFMQDLIATIRGYHEECGYIKEDDTFDCGADVEKDCCAGCGHPLTLVKIGQSEKMLCLRC